MRKRMTILLMAGILTMTPSGVVLAADGAAASGALSGTVQSDGEETVEVESIVPDKEKVAASGGEVKVTVTGTGLTADNWDIEVKAVIQGTDFAMDQLKAEVKDVTATGATLVIPANTMKNVIEYQITAGPVEDGQLTAQASASVLQEKKAENVSVDPKSVQMPDSRTIIATMPVDVSFAEADMDRLKSLIFVADYGNEGSGKYELGAEDTIEIKDRQVIIRTAGDIELTQYSALYIKEGALKNAEGLMLQDISWLITADTVVSGIQMETEILDSRGGEVTASLRGNALHKLEEGSVEAKVMYAGSSKATDIQVKVTYGVHPTLTFTVPENTTDRTQSYLLKVTVNGSPVIEGILGNPAERAVVSVLPEGKTAEDQTLAAMTISGNTEAGTDSDLSEIELTVSPMIGGLKAVLHLYGTNLDPTRTKLRAIDENGVIWPVYNIAECDGTFRFTAVAYEHKNGVTGEGNSQIVEILPARYAGTNKTYQIQVAIDGEHYLTVPTAQLTINNESIRNESGFTPCGPEDIKNVTVKYVEKGTGKELADTDVYKGYSISMIQGFDIGPKEIEGYQVITEPEIDPDNDYVENGREYVYEYEKVDEEEPGEEPGEEPAVLPFTDVYAGSAETEPDWFYEQVAYVYEHGLMTGLNDTTFGPNELLARAQFAVILHRMNGEPEVAYSTRFPDVADGQWYTDAILWAADTGVVTGYTDTGKFGPSDKINREQMAVMMYRYAQTQGYDTSTRADFSQYQDASQVSDYAEEALAWAVGEEIITGKYDKTQLDPKGNATRAECATIMMRVLEKYEGQTTE